MPNPPRPLSRRRLLTIGAALSATALAGLAPARIEAPLFWRGQALGAHAEIHLVGAPADVARAAVAAVEAEIGRLEAIFSLYRADSALSRLNADGRLSGPPPELLEVLALAAAAHRVTSGLFDPTVQPVFAVLAEHFAAPGADPAGPDRPRLEEALHRVGFAHVAFDTTGVAFRRPGMAMTLNGIAQGYVTDRVAMILKARGFANVLVDIGEIAASGGGRDGRGWRVGIADGQDRTLTARRLVLRDRAIATSMVRGTVLDAAGRVGHILHPRRGPIAPTLARVSVLADSAARADALSTAAALMTRQDLQAMQETGVELVV